MSYLFVYFSIKNYIFILNFSFATTKTVDSKFLSISKIILYKKFIFKTNFLSDLILYKNKKVIIKFDLFL